MFESAVAFVDESVDPGAAVSWLRRWLVPDARVRLVGRVARSAHDEDWGGFSERLQALHERLGAAAQALGQRIVSVDLDVGAAPGPLDAPLVVLATDDGERRRSLTAQALESGAVVAWVGGTAVSAPRVVVPFVRAELDALPAADLARSVAPDAELHGLAIHTFGKDPPLPSPAATQALLGWPRPVAIASMDAPVLGLSRTLNDEIASLGADLVILTAPHDAIPRTLLLHLVDACFASKPVTVLIVPDPRPVPELGPLLDATDALRVGDQVVGHVDAIDGFGRAAPWSGTLALVASGAVFDTVPVHQGRYATRLDPGLSLGLGRSGGLAEVERSVGVVPHDARPIGLFDAAEDAPAGGRREDLAWWGIRLDPGVPPSQLRARHPHAAAIVDAESVLGDGILEDVPASARVVRLRRCARRLRAQGIPVALVFAGGAEETFVAGEPGGDVLFELSAAPMDLARRVELVLDNGDARRRVLADIGAAQHHVHLQAYIFEEDATAAAFAEAACAAAARGVTVRVLIDALRSGQIGRANPLLTRLEATPGATVRIARPISGLPDLHDLKARDHRKLLVVDDRIAHVTGRNVGDPYYRGFDEVKLGPQSEARDVPWMDAGVIVEGQVVRSIASAFVDAWRAAGGEAPDPTFVGPPGEIPVRFVVHRSLVDAHTLELYRHLIDRARKRITLVNTFPVQFELEAALLRALGRGVAVRFVVGNVRPIHGPNDEPFRGGQLRDLATMVVHGRLDALVAAGAQALELGIAALPGWDPSLGVVRPHVHAKIVCVDGEALTVGSANLDITAGYWESEAVLLVEDAAIASSAEAAIEALLTHAVRHDPADPAYRLRVARREWIAHNWPSLLG